MEEVAVSSAAPALAGGDGAVRVVARIRPPSAATAAPTPAAGTSLFQVAASRGRRPRASGPGAGAVLSFTPTAAAAPTPPSISSSSSQGRSAAGQRKEEHRLDWCYLQDEDNHHVFLHELHPILAHHLQHPTTTTAGSSSSSACVVACGAAAAKDHLFKGSQDQPGLVTIAMEEILDFAASIGGAVMVSSYQVVQDTHVFDLLEPKDQEILVLEDAQGKTHLKGLSKVHVKSIEDFARLGCFDDNQDKQQQPTKSSSSTQQQPTKPFSTQQLPIKASSAQLPTRGHQGLLIHISSSDQDGGERAVAKINFLSLTDYVDPKQKNGGGVAALSSGNKSMYTLMNVVQALNSNQSFVPYRQSKVTRILQDSLCNTSGAVVIACLEEVSCQDAVSTLSLAARSSQVATQVSNEQCRRSSSVTSFKRADVNLSAVAKSSSRPILSSTHQPNPVVEKQDRPQWNLSAVKASRTPTANKRSQPIMHSAKKSENSVPTPIKITQKDAPPTMSGRSQPIMHPAKNPESSLSTPIKMPLKDAKPTISGRSQPIMHSAKKPESMVSPPTKMKQKEAKPAMSGRSQVMMRSAKKTESSLSASIKTKQKDAKPTTTSGSTLLCPSTKSAKEEAAVIAPATVTEVEEVQSSQGLEIDAPSTDEGFDKTRDALDTVPSEVQKVVSSGMAIDAPSTDEGFDKTSDALDTASSEIQKVVSSGMEDEDYSSSGLDAASSCTIDLGETCSPNIPDAFVEKTPVKTNMNTPKISDKLREISNSLRLLNARPLSVMAQKIAMEKTQEEGVEKTQKVAREKTQEAAMETTQEGMETTQGVAMEKTQEEVMETTEAVAIETTQEERMETTRKVATGTTQEVAVETAQEVSTGTTQEVAVETAQEVAVETTQEVAVETTQVAVETTQEVAVETAQELAVQTAQEVATERTQEVAVETTQVVAETAQEVAVRTAQELAVQTAQEVATERTQEVAVQTTQEVAVETAQEVAVETAQEEAVQTTQEVATETTQEVAVETTQEVGIETKQEAGMEYVQGGTYMDAPEPKTPAMKLKFEQAADHPTSSFKTCSTGMKKSVVQEYMSFLNSANKEQLKSLKGIGEKRANYIIELRENSPELFKGIDDLRDVIGMNKKEIKTLMSGIIDIP